LRMWSGAASGGAGAGPGEADGPRRLVATNGFGVGEV